MTHFLRLAPIFLLLFPCSTISAQKPLRPDSTNTDSLPDCALSYPPNTGVTLEPAWASPRNKSYSAAIAIVGNLNPQTDSIPEIIIPRNPNTTEIKLFFFRGDGANATQPDSMSLSGGMYHDVTPAIGDVDGDGIPELIYTAWDRYIRVLRNYTPGANPPMKDWLKADKQTRTGGFRPALADMNGDGTPEIVAGDEVFIVDLSDPVAPLLRKVLDANSFYGSDPSAYAPRLNCVATADLLAPADCGGDPDCEGLEIAAGPVIYSVDIDTTDGDGFEIKIQRNLNTQTLPDQYSDGYTAVADMNLDGIPDVVVSGLLNAGGANAKMGVYVWNKNGLVKFMLRPELPNIINYNYQYNGFPTIANVFDDRKRGLAKDFPEVISSGLEYFVCQNLHGTSFTDYSAWWYLPNSKNQGFYDWGNSSTSFDFNGDGYAEIVYGDNHDLRILYGGHLPFPPGVDANRNWAVTPGLISGRDSYPVIVDVDNDGQTEIVAVLRDSVISGMDTTGTWLGVFKSGGLPWPPSRTIWNQHNYNVVNVNDDLSIPAQPQKNWLELPAAGSGNRPLNMHLGQLPLLGPNQLPVLPLPDLQANVDSVACNQNQLILNIKVCNFGDAKLPAGAFVQFYLGNPAATAAAKFGAPLQIPVQAPTGQCVSWSANLPMPPNGTLWGVLNDNGSKTAPFNLATAFPSTTQLECDYTNNLFSVDISFSIPVLNLGPDRQACSNATTALHAGSGFSKYQWQDGSTDSSFTAQSPGKYWVDAWDVCSNKFTDTVSITAIPTPPIALGADRTLCAGDSLVLSLPGFDQIDWASAAGPVCNNCPAITLLPTNDLTLWATGKSGVCTLSDTLNLLVAPLPQLAAQLTPTNCGLDNGVISLQIDQGAAPYIIQWFGGLSGTLVDGLAAGQYLVTVTDMQGCKDFGNYLITPSDGPDFDIPVLTPVRCFGESNGKIDVTVNGGLMPYQYNWSTGPGNATLANVAAGTYSLTATDAAGCSTTAQFSITEPPALTIQATVDSTDCTSTTGGISVTAQGGTAGYNYLWSGGQTAAILSDLPPGIYTVTLTNANGCNVQQGFNIAPGGSPVLNNTQLTPVRCFGETNGQIEISAGGDAAPFQYVWPTGPGNGTLANLAAGNYTVTVTGSNGCSTTAQFSITEPPALTVQATVDSTDCTSTTGCISVAAQGGTAGYNYLWSGGQTTATLSDLQSGVYTVTLSDTNGCSVQQSFDIAPGGSPVLDNPLLTPVRCFGETNGQIEISAGGDAVPFQYVWPTGPGNGTLANLAAGNYTVTVTGSNGCSTTAQFSITEPPALTVQATVDSTDCTSTTGGISVTAQGGTAGYNYLWSGGQTTATLSDLQSGIYTVTLSDTNGCSVQQGFNIAPGGSPLLSDTQLTPVNCFGDSNGQIQVSLSGGAAPYQFNWSTGPGTEILPNLSAGTYTLTATDAKSCSITTQFDLGGPAALIVSGTTSPILCAGNTGSLQASAQGGTGPYTFAWENGDINAQRSGLASGSYTVTATDVHGCTTVQNFNLSEPPALSQSASVDSISCNSAGGITLAPQGGTPPYTFIWNDGSMGISNTGLAAGAFTVTTTDGNDCSIIQSFILDSGNAPILTDTLLTPVRCFGESNGQIQLIVDNGLPPYQAGWSNAGTGLILNGLSAGTYTVTVTDANNCTLSAQFALGQPALLQAGILAIGADTCGRHTGAIDLSAGGGVAPYQFLWSGGQQSEDLVQVAAGTWLLTLTDARGCSTQQNVVVPAVEINPVFDLSGGSITCAVPAVAIAVTPAPDDWTIRWQTPSGGILNGANQMVGTPGDYSVTVTNAAGCSGVQNLNVPANNSIPLALAAADQILIPCGQQSAVLDGSASAGGPEIETRWFRLENGQWGWDTLAHVVRVHQPGLYLLRVQDKNTGCTGIDSVQVIQAAGIDTMFWMTDSVSCFGRKDGSIRVDQITGGTPPFRYSIDNQTFSTDPIFNNLPAGFYPLQVLDAAGCTWQTGITIIEPDSFTVTLTASDTTLNLGQSLRLRATIWPPGIPLTNIEWLPADLFGASQELQQRFKPNETAWYEIRVSDAQGCTASANILVRVAQTGVYLPNAIRPEGQAGNTVFTVYAGADVRQVRLLRLYNRWGELLFERRDFSPNDESLGWDGRYRGQAVEAGVYVYHLVVELADGEELQLTGDVTVVR